MNPSFETLGLTPELLATVTDLGYIAPTPIQSAAIPHLLEGRDVIGQAQTGTGKTAAFSLPILHHLDLHGLQALILTPTRELAIQTAEAIHRYGSRLGVRVLPIYGGQPYERQVRRLEKGVQVVVGTPGRTLDLIRQGALDLSGVRFVVLDEADEMLKMGFIEDVETILSETDAQTRQTTLFSATLPEAIRRLAGNYMHNPLVVAVAPETVTVENVTQRFYMVRESEKIAALSRLLEVEDLKNTLIFARTKAGAGELAETLIARGYPAEAIHGDLPQAERERILARFRHGQLTILVATDVVARGVDIPDVSHVINFDIPQLSIEYVHRIGRTARAGQSGEAITIITPAQRHALRRIEEYIHKPIVRGELPSRDAVLARRHAQFLSMLLDQANAGEFDQEGALLEELNEMGYSPDLIAAAAIRLLRAHEAQRPLEDINLIKEFKEPSQRRDERRFDRRDERGGDRRSDRGSDRRPDRRESANGDQPRPRSSKRDRLGHEAGMVSLCMNLGHTSGIRPGDVVYTIASAANIPGKSIGAIDIRQSETYLDVPEAHADAVLHAMKDGKIRGQVLKLVRAERRSK
ncbi:MAG: DEAD/DEAH box helicase [Chloroflexi bacterium]|nr:DEAD/DEAH box helicase [Chloroflexota bacterium]